MTERLSTGLRLSRTEAGPRTNKIRFVIFFTGVRDFINSLVGLSLYV